LILSKPRSRRKIISYFSNLDPTRRFISIRFPPLHQPFTPTRPGEPVKPSTDFNSKAKSVNSYPLRYEPRCAGGPA
jgi:hypothetical protein